MKLFKTICFAVVIILMTSAAHAEDYDWYLLGMYCDDPGGCEYAQENYDEWTWEAAEMTFDCTQAASEKWCYDWDNICSTGCKWYRFGWRPIPDPPSDPPPPAEPSPFSYLVPIISYINLF